MDSYDSETLREVPGILSPDDRERLVHINTDPSATLAAKVLLYEELIDEYPVEAHPYLLVRKANLLLSLGGDAIAVELYRKVFSSTPFIILISSIDLHQHRMQTQNSQAHSLLFRENIKDEKLNIFLKHNSNRVALQAYAVLENSQKVKYYQSWKPTRQYVFPTNFPQIPLLARDLKDHWEELTRELPSFYTSYLIKVAIETNHVENTFLLDDMSARDIIRRGTIEGKISTQPQSAISDPDTIRNILNDTLSAYNLLIPILSSSSSTKPMDIDNSTICVIHATLMNTCRFLEGRYIAAGCTRSQTRKTVIVSGGYNVQMCPFPEVDNELEYILKMAKQWIRTWRNPFASASWTHLTLASCHPFDDGNGSLVRIIASLPLIQHGFPPISITLSQRSDYYAAVRKARGGDYTSLINCFVETMQEAIQTVEHILEA